MSDILRQATIIKLTVPISESYSEYFDMSLYAGGLINTDWNQVSYFLGFDTSTADEGQDTWPLYRTNDTPAAEVVAIANPADTWQPLPDELFGAKWVRIRTLDDALADVGVVGTAVSITLILKS